MKTYIDRLLRVGLSLGDAIVIVDDFLLEHDKDGLETYCTELERLHEMLTEDVEEICKQPTRQSNR
ncbi:MAG: hypothetical protein II433_10080 [Acidaminococcaceae bacterium]|nr:hypothetical protein [Acidaminococcaceae bacterium]